MILTYLLTYLRCSFVLKFAFWFNTNIFHERE